MPLYSWSSPTKVLTYAARWLGAALLMEFMSRTLYFNAIAKYGLLSKGTLAAAGLDVRPYHFALTGFWVLVYMWLKFLIIWRFFRAVALADGIVPPENMGRCVCNNYDIEGFWRSWHASYNRWLVRYVYVPLGGNRWVTDARAPDNYFFALPALNWYPLALSRDACCRLSAGMLLECKIMRGCRCFVSLL
ncbi:MBOAT, membrane-bound O-acyltransferase family-domain-containing protein [Dunaliella salina]|uniref:MBOAT, membrane-bound O-acyltransferase family-domain-containing protein n=1 Tax=Dunaliella salina TaxID=3046 RepID=A0ABQ7FTS3_DUNSA|nr:MBOAT, membrane-bound O-acyltransferase family-domain-containing protein [Dunaliella salina]|eukprot:KAF5825593.1 MBOAT, membrane-bound O-acyltransferase family-domain-containing protein [Dunaliella salina]